jgi:hypothetical protein
MKEFANEPVLELRRAPVRARLADAMREHDARGALTTLVQRSLASAGKELTVIPPMTTGMPFFM